jgi:hypothetical protein
MPILTTSAYVSVAEVMKRIRAIVNDMLYSQAGEILTDTGNLTFPLLNDALEWFQNEVNNHGVETFTKETILTPITPIATNDPGLQVEVSDTGYFDGAVSASVPVVPSDLLVPLRLWERQTGSIESWVPMTNRLDGLPSVAQGSRLNIWEWREDMIVMPGATVSNDLKLRYTGSQAHFATVDDILYFRGAAGAIAFKMVSVYLMSKNPDMAVVAGTEAEKRLHQLTMRSARMKQRAPVSRRSYGRQWRGSRFRPPSNP